MRDFLQYLKWAGLVALAVIVIILVFQNTEQVETQLLVTSVTLPRALLLLTTAAIGYAAGVLTMMLRRRR